MNVSHNALTILNISFNASSFDASYNALSSVTPEFWSSPNLVTVALDFANLSNLSSFAPFSAVNQTMLRSLSLSGNPIGNFSAFLNAFPAASPGLVSLGLRRANLSSTPWEVWTCPLCQNIDFGENPDFQPPLQAICTFGFASLSTLSIDHTNAYNVPATCLWQTRLQLLDISFSNFQGLEVMLDLPYLSILNARGLDYLEGLLQPSLQDDSRRSLIIPELQLTCTVSSQGKGSKYSFQVHSD